MDEEQLHQTFAKVVDASFALTMAFNTHGASSDEALKANAAYLKALRDYIVAKDLPFVEPTHWGMFCALNPSAVECRCYDV